jgi:hypothetical protein
VTRISSGWTFFSKRVFPTLWFGFLAFFVFVGISTGAVAKDVTFLIIPIAMAVFGFLLMRKLVWDLADEVYDCGHTLLVRTPGRRTRFTKNIMNVSVSTHVNRPHCDLSRRQIRERSRFTSAGFRLNPFAKIPVAEDLILRGIARS